MKGLVQLKDPNQKLPGIFLPDYIEEPVTIPVDEQEEKQNEQMMVCAGSVLVNCEDFGGSLAFPHYGFSRPSKDYYASNLILHNFVISDAASGISHIL